MTKHTVRIWRSRPEHKSVLEGLLTFGRPAEKARDEIRYSAVGYRSPSVIVKTIKGPSTKIIPRINAITQYRIAFFTSQL
jgi:hypothetical protein